MDIGTFNWAVKNGKIVKVERAINDKNRTFTLDDVDGIGCRPLQLAAVCKRFKLVKLLLNNGANPNLSFGRKDWLPFHWHYVVEDKELLDLFLTCGADVNAKGYLGITLLHQAIVYADIEMVKKILKSTVDVNVVDENNMIPLHCLLCAYDSDSDVVLKKIQLLIDRGADVINAANGDGDTPLFLAITHQSAEVVEFIIKTGASPNDEINHRSPLYEALERGDEDIIECLLKYGANMHAIDERGFSYLTAGCIIYRQIWKTGNYNTVKLLMEHGLRLGESDKHNLRKKEFQHLLDIQGDLDTMKVTKVCAYYPITFFDLLTKRGNSLVRLLRNERIREVMKSGEYKDLYVRFSDRLERNLERGLKRLDGLDEAAAVLYEIFDKLLPYEVILKIVEHFNDRELEKLIKS